MLGSQEKILEPKVNVKFFTVDPYTLCDRVSRPFPIWPIWQIWSLLGQKNIFFGGLRAKGKSNMESFLVIAQTHRKGFGVLACEYLGANHSMAWLRCVLCSDWLIQNLNQSGLGHTNEPETPARSLSDHLG